MADVPWDFRPKIGTGSVSAARTPAALARASQKALRRMIRSRFIVHLKETEEIKDSIEEKLDALNRNSLLLDEVGQMVVQAQELEIETEAALDFAQHGAHLLEELMMAPDGEAFSSYDAFIKSGTEDTLAKRFGPAGDGYQYHHIVEEGVNDGIIPAGQLQNTDNIIRIPTLLHEEISAVYGRAAPDAPTMSLRQWLKGQPYQTQYDWGLKIMRELGILRE
jgi:hypothetical protein